MEKREGKGSEKQSTVSFDLNSKDAWDDSLLISAWDSALEEYKKYHSIHLRNEHLDGIPDESEVSEVLEDPKSKTKNGTQAENDVDKFSSKLGNQEAERTSSFRSRQDSSILGQSPLQEDFDSSAILKHVKSYGLSDIQGKNLIRDVYDELATRSERTAGPRDGRSKNGESILHTQTTSAVTADRENESLRNLMMSWYYAGYYTGFYEGQNNSTAMERC